jgi:hypothetical protein
MKQETVHPMTRSFLLPLEHEAVLAACIIRPSVKPPIVPLPFDLMIKTGSKFPNPLVILCNQILEHRERVDTATGRTALQERNPSAIRRLGALNRRYRVWVRRHSAPLSCRRPPAISLVIPKRFVKARCPEGDITILLHEWSAGHDEAFSQLLPMAYARLKAIAGLGCAASPAVTRSAKGQEDWQDREHFYRFCARAMRWILIDRARPRIRENRKPDLQIPLTDEMPWLGRRQGDISNLDRAL